jgi:teichuronic acid biosynthesis glycosyltransferase TuaH
MKLHHPDTAEHKLARIAYASENRWVERGLKADQVIRQAILDKGMSSH